MLTYGSKFQYDEFLEVKGKTKAFFEELEYGSGGDLSDDVLAGMFPVTPS